MKAKTFLMVFFLLGLALSSFSQPIGEILAEADTLFLGLKDMETAVKIKAMYEQVAEAAPDKYEAFWKLSRIHYYIGSHTDDKKAQQGIFEEGVAWADKAIQAGPDKPDGHYWSAINNGSYGESKGVLKSLSLVKPIKDAMNKVVEIDRTYQGGGADRILGRLYFKVPGFAGGDKDLSLDHLLKAKDITANDPHTCLYLAETYLALDKVEEARAELDTVLGLEDDGLWLSGVKECQADARILLEDRKFRK